MNQVMGASKQKWRLMFKREGETKIHIYELMTHKVMKRKIRDGWQVVE